MASLTEQRLSRRGFLSFASRSAGGILGLAMVNRPASGMNPFVPSFWPNDERRAELEERLGVSFSPRKKYELVFDLESHVDEQEKVVTEARENVRALGAALREQVPIGLSTEEQIRYLDRFIQPKVGKIAAATNGPPKQYFLSELFRSLRGTCILSGAYCALSEEAGLHDVSPVLTPGHLLVGVRYKKFFDPMPGEGECQGSFKTPDDYSHVGAQARANYCLSELNAEQVAGLVLNSVAAYQFRAKKDVAAAIKSANNGIFAWGTYPSLHLTLASANIKRGNLEGAKASILTAMKLDPDFAPANLTAAVWCEANADIAMTPYQKKMYLEKGLMFATVAANMDSHYVGARAAVGRLQRALGMEKESVASYVRAGNLSKETTLRFGNARCYAPTPDPKVVMSSL
ncbi:MAG: hypothetical protein OXR66_08975 [Candidatus Woesearchaeota archaeon]|nr:hypothetical protein [Candidatus Woesearchaeota archaeon]